MRLVNSGLRAAHGLAASPLGSVLTRVRDVPLVLWLWMVAGSYEAAYLFRGWIPHDDGALAHSAEAVLSGQLPHRDFDELYTGGLTFFHALAFLLVGTDLTSLRIVLFVFFLAWVPALFFVGRRFVHAPLAAALTLVAVAWSVPNYSASMPSWYNLFFATFALASLLRYLEARTARWLFVAGAMCGFSIAIKVTGVLALAAGAAFLLFYEQSLSSTSARGRRRGVYSVAVVVLVVLIPIAVAGLVGSRLGVREFVDFVVPVGFVAGCLAWNELRLPRESSRVRLARLARLLVPLGTGALAPIAALLVPYVSTGSVGQLVLGTVVDPQSRLEFAALPPPPLLFALTLVPLGALIALASLAHRWIRLVSAGIGVVLAVVLVTRWAEVAGALGWLSLRSALRFLLPIGIALVVLSVRRRQQLEIYEQRAFLLLATVAFLGISQFPFGAEIYFAYIVPLVFVALVALPYVGRVKSPRVPASVIGAVISFYLAVGVVAVNPSFFPGSRYELEGRGARLGLPRAGMIRATDRDVAMYRRVVYVVRAHSTGKVHAGPDSPEIYFLTGAQNPSGLTFDFLSPPAERARRVTAALAGASVVVVNRHPDFSPPFDRATMAAIRARFPNVARAGDFDVHWR